MTKIKFISAASLALLLMTGCTTNQPSFDSADTAIQVVDGKSYNIPKGAQPSPYVDAKVIKFYQKVGLTECKEGDITWEEEKAKEEMGVAISQGDKGIYKKLADQGRIGCSSPISAK